MFIASGAAKNGTIAIPARLMSQPIRITNRRRWRSSLRITSAAVVSDVDAVVSAADVSKLATPEAGVRVARDGLSITVAGCSASSSLAICAQHNALDRT